MELRLVLPETSHSTTPYSTPSFFPVPEERRPKAARVAKPFLVFFQASLATDGDPRPTFPYDGRLKAVDLGGLSLVPLASRRSILESVSPQEHRARQRARLA